MVTASTPLCFECNSKRTVRNGKKKNGVQNYKCNDCKRQFTETKGTIFYRKRTDARQTLAISALLNIKGAISFRTTVQFIELICGVKRAHTTYYYRHLSLEGKVDGLLSIYKPDYGRIWHIDELFNKVKGMPGKFGYLFVVVDQHSNILSVLQSDRRDTLSAKKALQMAREQAGFAPDIIVSDGCPIYDKATTIFGRKTKHCIAHFKKQPFCLIKDGKKYLYYLSNNIVEHVNSYFREWMHHMRGFKSLEKANIWCKMFQFTYNFLRSGRLIHLAAALLSR